MVKIGLLCIVFITMSFWRMVALSIDQENHSCHTHFRAPSDKLK